MHEAHNVFTLGQMYIVDQKLIPFVSGVKWEWWNGVKWEGFYSRLYAKMRTFCHKSCWKYEMNYVRMNFGQLHPSSGQKLLPFCHSPFIPPILTQTHFIVLWTFFWTRTTTVMMKFSLLLPFPPPILVKSLKITHLLTSPHCVGEVRRSPSLLVFCKKCGCFTPISFQLLKNQDVKCISHPRTDFPLLPFQEMHVFSC